MTKKILAIVLALVMLTSAAAFAEGTSAGIAPILGFGGEWASGSWGISQLPLAEGDPIHVSCMFPRQSGHPETFDETMWWNQELLKRANVVIDWQLVEKAGFEEKKNLVLASGDYPDIFMDGITKADEQMFGPLGIFVNLAPLIEEYAPNTRELFERYPDVKKSLSYPDGAIYNMCDFNITPRDQFVSAPYYREAWLENLGMEAPSTLEELYDIFVAVRDKDADGDGDTEDEIPLLYSYTNTEFKTAVLAAYGLIALNDDYGVMADYVKDGQYLFVPVQEGYKEYLTYMNKLYTEGIMSPDCFTASGEQINAQVQSLNVFMHAGTPYGVMPNDEDWIDKEDMLPFLTSDISDEQIWPGTLRHVRSWGNFVMTDKCEYPVEMVKLQDYFYSEVGSMMVRAGREKGTYDEFGWEIIMLEDGEWTAQIHYDAENFSGYYQWRMHNSPLQGTYVAGEFQNKVMIASDYKNNWYSETKMATGRTDFMQIPYPEVTYTEEEQDTMMIYVDIANYVSSMEAQFITGKESLEDWDEYVNTIYAMGLEDIIKVKQDAYDRWNLN